MKTSEIPTVELIKDKEDSLSDIAICEYALKCGIETYSGGLVRDRLNTNKNIVAVINNELQVRGVIQ